MTNDPITELHELALYVEGMAEASNNDRLRLAAEWLEKASENICAQGYFGCRSGKKCTSDHK